MTSVDAGVIRLDQFLFGYRDGHRMLAGSRKISDDTASTLLLYSDLAPGLSSGFSPYWTALTLKSAKAVALMRTWPAPEMPRPGCVWTHAVLLPFAELARIDHLSKLQSLFQRPQTAVPPAAAYSAPIVFDGAGKKPADIGLLSRKTIFGLIDAIYDSPPGGGTVPPSPDLEEAIFAFWSQQWPRLRRSFSFQTALADESLGVSPFDLTISRRADESPWQSGWKSAAADDVIAGDGPLKEFLWHFGGDIEDGKLSYKTLVEVFQQTTLSPHLLGSRQLLELLGTVFPERGEARSLKDAILGLEGQTSISIPANEALYFLSDRSSATGFGIPSPALMKAAATKWPSAYETLAHAASRLLERGDIDHQVMIEALSDGLELPTLLKIAPENQALFAAVLSNHPDLLEANALNELSPEDIETIAGAVPNDDLVVNALLDRLLAIDNGSVASAFSNRFPLPVSLRVFVALSRSLLGEEMEIPQAWADSIRDYLSKSVQSTLLGSCQKQSQLAACALILGLDVSAGLKHNSSDWAKLLNAADRDLSGDNQLRLFAFLLALALAKPENGCEPIFELCFDSVHQAIAVSTLPYDAFNVLAPYMPNLHYRDQWDTCLRLRLAVVTSYVDKKLSLHSFKRLSSHSAIQGWLVELAEKKYDGRQYLKGR